MRPDGLAQSARRRRRFVRSAAVRSQNVGESLRCSFCGKSQPHVKKLMGGPGVYICSECVDFCVDIMPEEEYKVGVSSRSSVRASVPVALSRSPDDEDDQAPHAVGTEIDQLLAQMDEREQAMIRYRFGLDSGEIHPGGARQRTACSRKLHAPRTAPWGAGPLTRILHIRGPSAALALRGIWLEPQLPEAVPFG